MSEELHVLFRRQLAKQLGYLLPAGAAVDSITFLTLITGAPDVPGRWKKDAAVTLRSAKGYWQRNGDTTTYTETADAPTTTHPG